MAEDKVKELREELRLGRNKTTDDSSTSIDGTSTNSEGISGSNHSTQSGVFIDLFGSSTEDDATNVPHDDPERSADEIIKRGGSTNRRFGKSGSSSSNSTETITGAKRRAGRLVADDPIPIRQKAKSITKSSGSRSGTPESIESTKEETKTLSIQRGKKTVQIGDTTGEGKSEKSGFKLPSIKEGSVLTIAEAKALEGPLLSALESDFTYIDQYIWYRTQDQSQTPIWSDMDNEDLTILCTILLKRGQKSPVAAATVRGIVNGSTYVDVAMLMAPRFIKTVQVLKAAPKIERPGFMERKRMIRG